VATSHPYSWERPLLALAYEAQRTRASEACRACGDPAVRARAYAHCARITARHSHTFHLATMLLPRDKRRAIRALYAFCRVSDTIVDSYQRDVAVRLARWRRSALAPDPPADDLIATAWADARARYHIPVRYAEQLIDGVARDLCQTHYASFDELTTYAYGVAATVGLMSMQIIGFTSIEAIPYAIKLGVALQVTNILRDVAEDRRRGRTYLPADELAAFDLRDECLARGRVDDRWRAFMRFQIARNRRLYAEARPGIALLHRDGRFAVAAAAGLYQAILDDVEAHDYDVFHRRAHLSAWGKLRRLPAIWWHVPRSRAANDQTL
jgi:phytoene synthase